MNAEAVAGIALALLWCALLFGRPLIGLQEFWPGRRGASITY
jgi:hypothetical protein